jgi:CheY-like chemotaxis protein
MEHQPVLIDRVLLIDNDREDCRIFADAMENVLPKVLVKCATNYAEAMQALSKFLPDLIFMDVNMPEKNGLDFLSMLREDPIYKTLPIVMHSSSSVARQIDLAYQLGANMYYVKPSSFPELKKGLQEIVEMDWFHPERIKESLYMDGRYHGYAVRA